jgi:hypothetical protein
MLRTVWLDNPGVVGSEEVPAIGLAPHEATHPWPVASGPDNAIASPKPAPAKAMAAAPAMMASRRPVIRNRGNALTSTPPPRHPPVESSQFTVTSTEVIKLAS